MANVYRQGESQTQIDIIHASKKWTNKCGKIRYWKTVCWYVRECTKQQKLEMQFQL